MIAARQETARINALMPEMESRYARLLGSLEQAAAGADVPEWEIALHRTDLASVLEIMAPSDDDDPEDSHH
jgi:hypothetical protein